MSVVAGWRNGWVLATLNETVLVNCDDHGSGFAVQCPVDDVDEPEPACDDAEY